MKAYNQANNIIVKFGYRGSRDLGIAQQYLPKAFDMLKNGDVAKEDSHPEFWRQILKHIDRYGTDYQRKKVLYQLPSDFEE